MHKVHSEYSILTNYHPQESPIAGFQFHFSELTHHVAKSQTKNHVVIGNNIRIPSIY